jgi:hypothetical protein
MLPIANAMASPSATIKGIQNTVKRSVFFTASKKALLANIVL